MNIKYIVVARGGKASATYFPSMFYCCCKNIKTPPMKIKHQYSFFLRNIQPQYIQPKYKLKKLNQCTKNYEQQQN